MKPKSLNDAVAAMQGAAGCEDCFRMGLDLTRSLCDAPQPRWIGMRYFAASPRVAVVLINPGGGGSSANPALAREADLFREFHSTGDYERVRDYFMAAIRRGDSWLSWYRDKFGLNHDVIAQLNIAWCPTRKDKYPVAMLRHCFCKHTSTLLCALEPDIVLLSGSATHQFAKDIQRLLPRAEVVKTIHYKNRNKTKVEKMAEARRVKDIIAAKATGV